MCAYCHNCHVYTHAEINQLSSIQSVLNYCKRRCWAWKICSRYNNDQYTVAFYTQATASHRIVFQARSLHAMATWQKKKKKSLFPDLEYIVIDTDCFLSALKPHVM